MKIDEACINHNAVKLIDDILADPYSWCFSGANEEQGKSDNHHSMLMAIGEINGVLDMARAMKEVLKA